MSIPVRHQLIRVPLVFLKELEYFGGIVFLTTNRVETFDQAMKSRTHLSLTYSPPEIETRRRIWLQCLRAISKDDSGIDHDKSIEHLVTAKLNGREIANAVNTAKTIARFERKPLDLGHLEMVLEVRDAFDRRVQNA
jgi:SpoVK/Ycf46/Vps4 family AAA+-type ATPase